jgi:chromosome segregation ATPase
MNIIDSVRGLLSSRQAKGAATLAYLVEAIVSGREVQPAEVLASLDKLGLTLADLEAACAEERKRRTLLDQAEAGRLAGEELAGMDGRIQAEWDAFQREYKALDLKYGPSITALRERKTALQAIRSRGEKAEQSLRAMAPAELKQRVQDLRQEGRAIEQRRGALREAEQTNRYRLRHDQERARTAESAEAREHYQAEAAQVEQRLAQLQQERDRIDQRERELREEDGRVDAAILELN